MKSSQLPLVILLSVGSLFAISVILNTFWCDILPDAKGCRAPVAKVNKPASPTLLEGNTYRLLSPTPATKTLADYEAASALVVSNDYDGLNRMKAQGRYLELGRGQDVIYRGCEGALCGIAKVERVSDRQQFFIPRKSLTE